MSRYTPAARFTLSLADAARLVDIPGATGKSLLLDAKEDAEFRFSQNVDQDQFFKLLEYARFLMLPAAGKDELAKAECQPQIPVFGCHSSVNRKHEEDSLNLLSSFA